jgi:hypothetical protein
MTTIAIILNIGFAAGVVGGIVGMLVWSVATQHRDHGVLAAGSLVRRRLWSGLRSPQPAPTRQRIATGRAQISLGT